MREILFRGKRVDNGEWVYGLLCRVGDTYANIVEKSTEVMCTVLTNTIGQFTGGVDKTGKKIFGADIIQGICNLTGELIIGYVEYHPQTMKYCVHSKDNIVSLYQCRNIKVIGNIHDNPELLEEKE